MPVSARRATSPGLVRCIRLDLDCADVCEATAHVLARQTALEPATARALLEACAEACCVCAEECERHADMGMEHCRVCADSCRRCESACREALKSIAASRDHATNGEYVAPGRFSGAR